jgi:hypothetical protein
VDVLVTQPCNLGPCYATYIRTVNSVATFLLNLVKCVSHTYQGRSLQAQMQSNGYATVASSIAQDPDKETYIFCRFDKLTARNLLNLQGELLVLQDELDELDAKVAKSPDPDLHSSMRSWKILVEHSKVSQGRTGEEERKRLKIARALEVKLKKYRESARVENHPPRTPT